MNFKYAVFDMDGTLLDSMNDWLYCEKKIIGDYCGFDFVSDKECNVLGLNNIVQYAIDKTGVNFGAEDVLPDIYRLMSDKYENTNIKPKEGAVEFLKFLKEKGIKIAIATATDFEMCENCLKRNGILDYIDTFVSTKQAGHSKTRPDVYLKAMEIIGAVKQETLIFEDAAYCVETLYNNKFRYAIVFDSAGYPLIPDYQKEAAEIQIFNYKELIK